MEKITEAFLFPALEEALLAFPFVLLGFHSDNGSVIRKHMGYGHIPKQHAASIHLFYTEYFNSYLNFHRPSGYATVITNEKGKQKKIYDLYETPYAHFKKLLDARLSLRPGISFETLDLIERKDDDNACAKLMLEAKKTLFKSFQKP